MRSHSGMNARTYEHARRIACMVDRTRRHRTRTRRHGTIERPKRPNNQTTKQPNNRHKHDGGLPVPGRPPSSCARNSRSAIGTRSAIRRSTAGRSSATNDRPAGSRGLTSPWRHSSATTPSMWTPDSGSSGMELSSRCSPPVWSTSTVSPSCTVPASSIRASWSPTSVWTRRRSGLAP